jgi:hypothetical protein
MKNLLILSAAALVVLAGAISFIPSLTSAYKGNLGVGAHNCSPERHQAMELAFENNDYNAWSALMQGRGRVTQVVNQENFAKFAEAHKLAEQGKLEEAHKIMQELGLGIRNGSGHMMGQGVRWMSR